MRALWAVMLWSCLLASASSQELVTLNLFSDPPGAMVYSGNDLLGHTGQPIILPRALYPGPFLRLQLKAPNYADEEILLQITSPEVRFPDRAELVMRPVVWWAPAYNWAALHPVEALSAVILLGMLLSAMVGSLLRSKRRGHHLKQRLQRLESLAGDGQDAWVGKQMGRWRLVERLGPGQYAAVLDEELLTGRRYRLKLPLPEELKQPESVARFHREIQLGSQLVHPNIVKIEDFGSDHDYPFLVTELVPGRILRELIPLSLEQARPVFCQSLEALAYVHTQNLLHCNLSPDSLILRPDGRVLLIDFSLAGRAQSTYAVGDSKYAAPEQREGGYHTARTDQYALGVTFYELLTGNLYKGSLEGCPEPLAPLLAKMLAPDPKNRYSGLHEVLEALKAV